MDDDEKKPVWLTILKLVVIASVLIGGVALALWYAGDLQQNATPAAVTRPGDWGIANDSPVRSKR